MFLLNIFKDNFSYLFIWMSKLKSCINLYAEKNCQKKNIQEKKKL